MALIFLSSLVLVDAEDVDDEVLATRLDVDDEVLATQLDNVDAAGVLNMAAVVCV